MNNFYLKPLPMGGARCNTNFSYIIALDFEATCWPGSPRQFKSSQEIIEFPAVLVNLKSGKIESEFHYYIKPTEIPQLSEFCLKLTGIRQQVVDAGISLNTCLTLFDQWLKRILSEKNLVLPKTDPSNPKGSVAFATWTDWDLSTYLKDECSRKGIQRQNYFNRWIDIRRIYGECYNRRSGNFIQSLNQLGIAFQGKQHSGIDDARNLSEMIARMARDGAKFYITKDLNPLY
ncbi:ERI1 exoribonuclease 2 [Toxorhynchites rutilus septentrionalis]|uniref:ERI1 exoribonuclease 2 n=1 Tax=Toxorhynchites rutilus septentrionalis TaxID=329112 RepID=UPI002478FCAA|nr:ERI1 exoribonuclease 2 [Toxorhynchites rutilus septentrionalis]